MSKKKLVLLRCGCEVDEDQVNSQVTSHTNQETGQILFFCSFHQVPIGMGLDWKLHIAGLIRALDQQNVSALLISGKPRPS